MSGDRSGVAATTRALPSGTVTFVFTDIEGSTRLLKRHPDIAPDLFERHCEIVRTAIADCGGCEVNTEGDAFFVAFDGVDQAIAACAQLQHDLAAEPWPDGAEVRVRVGIHTGVAIPRNDDYIAMAVHQAARVVNTAHGGQIIATRSTLDGRHVPAPVNESSLGRFRVRDFDEPVELVRLDPIGLPPTERPLRAIPADGHNLVRVPTSFIGRESVLDKVLAVIAQGFIVSVVGPGGTGKTRLAVEVGLEHASEWDDGVWLAELADVSDAALVESTIADAVGLSPAPDSDVHHELLVWARDRRALLIVDNIESCLDACARLLPALAASGLAIMTTSREPLNVPAEVVWRLDPLGVAPPDSDDAVLASSPAVELFVDRATSVRPDFDPTPHLADIARICAQLDGLPLAIEIAAARVKVLTVPEILEGLADRFNLLRSSERHRPERQRTLRGLLQWSYDLLDDDSRAALRRLSVFAGSFTLRSAAVALAYDDQDPSGPGRSMLAAEEAPELVWSLFDKSLIALDQSGSGTRYRLLESVREFALGLLVESGESDVVVGRVANDLLDRVGPWRPPDRQWLGEMSVEVTSLRGLIAPLMAVDHERAQAAACSLGAFHDATQRFEAGISELTSLVERLGEPTPTRSVLLAALADLHLRRGEHDEAERLLVAAAELRDLVGTPPWAAAAIERTRGEVLLRRGDFASAVDVARAALDRADLSIGEEARMWNLLGIASMSDGDLETSRVAFLQELAAYSALDLDTKAASANGNVAEVMLRLGDTRAAASRQLASLEAALVIGQPVMVAFSAVVAAHLAARLGVWETAVRLQSAAEAGLAAAGTALYPSDAEALEQLRADAKEHLSPDEVDVENAAGARLDTVETAELARQVLERVVADGTGAQNRLPSSHGKDRR